MKRIGAVLGTALAMLVAVLLLRAALVRSETREASRSTPIALDVDAAVARLAGSLRFETVTTQERPEVPPAAFLALHRHLEESFPRVRAALGREVVAGASLLYTWPGKDAAQRPTVLMSHLDVVPVEAGTESTWSHPPFAGEIAEGHVWGRGAMDDKVGVLAILEASEALLAEGFQPPATVYFAFGHDEEGGGAGASNGASEIARLLKARGVAPELVLDEGGAIVQGLVPGVTKPVALVGVSEKGYVSVELVARCEGGHSSMPPRHTAPGILALAITRLEKRPFPARLDGPSLEMIEALTPEMAFGRRVALANLWLFRPLVEQLLGAQSPTDTLVRTTTAVTMLRAGDKENVLPREARAVVNFRIRPGETQGTVVERVRQTVRGLPVDVTQLPGGGDPSPVSDTRSPSYLRLRRAILGTFPDVVVAPNVVVGATDARFFAPLSRNVYRFTPLRIRDEDLHRVHGVDERLAVSNYAEVVQFYAAVLRETAALSR